DLGGNGARLAPVLRERFGAFGSVAAMVVILMLLLDLVAQIMTIARVGFLDAMNSTSITWELLTSTFYGLGWFAKIAAALLLLGVMLFIWRKPRQAASAAKPRIGPASWDVAMVAGSLFILGLSLSSHAAAVHTEPTASAAGVAATTVAEDHAHGLGLPLPVLADWLHAAMASLWVGGLFYMTLVLFPAFRLVGFSLEDRRAFLARAVPRFSRLAILSVVTLAVTGTYSVITHSNDLGTIFSTEYGLVLALKIAAYGVLVALGATNLMRLTPALQDKVEGGKQVTTAVANPRRRAASGMLARNVRLEAAIAIIAVVCAAGLTLLPPPSGSSGTAAASLPTPLPSSSPVPVTSSSVVAGYTVTLTANPSLDGDMLTADILATSPAAVPLTDVAKVLFRVTPQAIDAGTTSYIADLKGALTARNGAWIATEPIFTLDGDYLITVIVERTVAPDIKAGFRLTLSNGTLTSTSTGVVDVFVSSDPSPPISGTATLKLTVHDGAGQPVENATISVSPQQPARGYVGPVTVAQPVPGDPGQYTTTVQFVSGGAWLLIFNVEREGQPAIKTDASLDVIGPEITPVPGP
ncbi:MAG TPA: CopD family protein, partial [Chloroflexia bacterium]|nr:CopD family protein [Chloroflexia bacterium]